jgi:hypothetical protein
MESADPGLSSDGSLLPERLEPPRIHPHLRKDLGGVLAQGRRIEAPPIRSEWNRRPHLDACLGGGDEPSRDNLRVRGDLADVEDRFATDVEPGKLLLPFFAGPR